MAKTSKYVAKKPDENGFIYYSEEENAIWHELITRQKSRIEHYPCLEYREALAALELPEDRIPQCDEVSAMLFRATGWRVAPVEALISFDEFFQMLNDKIFPAASFIRSREELDYLQEPDIFHEIYGHTPLLQDERFAQFTQAIGRIGLQADKKDHSWLARLYWFTIEFGLIRTDIGVRPYGAGIVSSYSELPYSVESDQPDRRPFELIDVLRTPYRIDVHQYVYFVLESFDQLFELVNEDLLGAIHHAQSLGLHESKYPAKEQELSVTAS